jgi:nonsense-mediated mRNA decay protein 3
LFIFSDYLEFLDDLEEDPAYRQNVNIFRDKSKEQTAVDVDDLGDETIPHITLDEMLDDLTLEDVEMRET